ncbi:MAG TPA: hypothetical protein PK648_06170, partial [Verrucomicrobiales bacterium]|nr:hypothetical protein [Verrucomicrobiales bacterium]
ALSYFEDGGIDLAIPPLKALLHIMAYGSYDGKNVHDPEIRALFDRERVLTSDWYRARLVAKKDLRMRLIKQHIVSLQDFLDLKNYEQEAARLKLAERLEGTKASLSALEKDPEAYLQSIVGTIGLDPSIFG